MVKLFEVGKKHDNITFLRDYSAVIRKIKGEYDKVYYSPRVNDLKVMVNYISRCIKLPNNDNLRKNVVQKYNSFGKIYGDKVDDLKEVNRFVISEFMKLKSHYPDYSEGIVIAMKNQLAHAVRLINYVPTHSGWITGSLFEIHQDSYTPIEKLKNWGKGCLIPPEEFVREAIGSMKVILAGKRPKITYK